MISAAFTFLFRASPSLLHSSTTTDLATAVLADPLPLHEALSGILGSISLTSWLCLLVPQLIENYRNQSAEAISLPFILIWFLGDVCNLLGGLWAGLVPVVVAVAAYFCVSDTVLLAQVLYYGIRNRRREGRSLLAAARETVTQDGTRRDSSAALATTVESEEVTTHVNRQGSHTATETQPLLKKKSRSGSFGLPGSRSTVLNSASRRRRSSATSGKSHSGGVRRRSSAAVADEHLTRILEESSSDTGVREWLKLIVSIFAVCAIGTAGWALAYQSGAWRPSPPEPTGNGGGSGAGEDPEETIAKGAQILGYASAVLYLCARIPQIIKNWREKSCEGLALLFFILSLMGNLTYGAGIVAHSTNRTYMIKNVPWLIGSLGTMVEDIIIFIQFHVYKNAARGDEVVFEDGDGHVIEVSGV